MSECEEIAERMHMGYIAWLNGQPSYMESARIYVRKLMPDESYTVVDNIAEALYFL